MTDGIRAGWDAAAWLLGAVVGFIPLGLATLTITALVTALVLIARSYLGAELTHRLAVQRIRAQQAASGRYPGRS